MLLERPQMKSRIVGWLLTQLICVTTMAGLAAVVHAAPSEPVGYRPVVGELHPDFVLPNIETGEPVRLSDLKGKKVLLIHFASW